VILVGIGAATLVIGAVANSFFARTVGEIELAENDLRLKVRDISLRLQTLERTIAQRRSVRDSDS
jgi:hypothetical protein